MASEGDPAIPENASTLERYFDESFRKAIFASILLLGVFFLFSYFFHIDYFPIFDFGTATSLLVSLAYVVGILLLLIAVSLLLPHIFVGMLIHTKRTPAGDRKLAFQIAGWTLLCMLCLPVFSLLIYLSTYVWHDDSPWTALAEYVSLVAICCALYALDELTSDPGRYRAAGDLRRYAGQSRLRAAAWFRSIVTEIQRFRQHPKNRIKACVHACLEVLGGFWRILQGPARLSGKRRRNRAPRRRPFDRGAIARRRLATQISGVMFTSVSQLFPWIMITLIMSRGSPFEEADFMSNMTAVLQVAMILAFFGGPLLYFALSRKRFSAGRLVLVCLMVATLPAIATTMMQAQGFIPMTMATLTKMGNFRAERMVINGTACETVRPLLGLTCDFKDNKPVEICNVHVMSRVGGETYIRLAIDFEDQHGYHRVARVFLPSSDIKSFEVNFEKRNFKLSSIDKELAMRTSRCVPAPAVMRAEVLFSVNTFRLDDAARARIVPVLEAIRSAPGQVEKVRITGYGDGAGKEADNQRLARLRADEIRRYLDGELKNTVPAVLVDVSGRTGAAPAHDACSPARGDRDCMAHDRRAEIELLRADRHQRIVDP